MHSLPPPPQTKKNDGFFELPSEKRGLFFSIVGDTQKGVQLKGVLHKSAFCTFLHNYAQIGAFLQAILACKKAQKRTKKCKNAQKCTKTRHFAQTHAIPPFIIPPLACTQNRGLVSSISDRFLESRLEFSVEIGCSKRQLWLRMWGPDSKPKLRLKSSI